MRFLAAGLAILFLLTLNASAEVSRKSVTTLFRIDPPTFVNTNTNDKTVRVLPGKSYVGSVVATSELKATVYGVWELSIIDPEGKVISSKTDAENTVIFKGKQVAPGQVTEWRPPLTLPANLKDGVYSARARYLALDGKRVYAEATNDIFMSVGNIVATRPEKIAGNPKGQPKLEVEVPDEENPRYVNMKLEWELPELNAATLGSLSELSDEIGQIIVEAHWKVGDDEFTSGNQKLVLRLDKDRRKLVGEAKVDADLLANADMDSDAVDVNFTCELKDHALLQSHPMYPWINKHFPRTLKGFHRHRLKTKRTFTLDATGIEAQPEKIREGEKLTGFMVELKNTGKHTIPASQTLTFRLLKPIKPCIAGGSDMEIAVMPEPTEINVRLTSAIPKRQSRKILVPYSVAFGAGTGGSYPFMLQAPSSFKDGAWSTDNLLKGTIEVQIVNAPDIVVGAVRAFKYGGAAGDSVTAGQEASITMDLRNAGTLASGEFKTMYFVNGVEIKSERHSALAPGARHVTGVTHKFDAPGEYELTGEISGIAGETNSVNNRVTVRVIVSAPAAPPDIAIEQVSVPKTFIYPGEEVTVTATMRNIGGATATGISTAGRLPKVAWSIANAERIPDPIEAIIQVEQPWKIAPGQTFSQSAKFKFLRAGSANIEARYPVVPGENSVENNVKVLVVAISSRETAPPPTGPDIEVTRIRTLPESVVAGQTCQLSIVGRNIGTSTPTGSPIANFYVNGQSVRENYALKPMDMIAGQEIGPSITYTFQSAGTYKIKAVIANVGGEQRTDNNSAEATVYVSDAAAGLRPSTIDPTKIATAAKSEPLSGAPVGVEGMITPWAANNFDLSGAGRDVTWHTQWPQPSFDNDPAGENIYGKWDASLRWDGNSLCLAAKNLHSPQDLKESERGNGIKVWIGYKVTLTKGTFEDGSRERFVVLHGFEPIGRQGDFEQCLKVVPLAPPAVVCPALYLDNRVRAGGSGTQSDPFVIPYGSFTSSLVICGRDERNLNFFLTASEGTLKVPWLSRPTLNPEANSVSEFVLGKVGDKFPRYYDAFAGGIFKAGTYKLINDDATRVMYLKFEGAPVPASTAILSILRVWTEPSPPIAGQEATLYAEVKNSGNGDTTIQSAFDVNGSLVKIVAPVDVKAGQTVQVSTKYTFTAAGDVAVKFPADGTNAPVTIKVNAPFAVADWQHSGRTYNELSPVRGPYSLPVTMSCEMMVKSGADDVMGYFMQYDQATPRTPSEGPPYYPEIYFNNACALTYHVALAPDQVRSRGSFTDYPDQWVRATLAIDRTGKATLDMSAPDGRMAHTELMVPPQQLPDFLARPLYAGFFGRSRANSPGSVMIRNVSISGGGSVTATPNLSTLRVWTEPSQPIAGQEATLFAEVKNSGNGDTTIQPSFDVNGTLVKIAAPVEVKAGQTIQLSAKYGFTAAGDVSVKFSEASPVIINVKPVPELPPTTTGCPLMSYYLNGTLRLASGRDPFIVPEGTSVTAIYTAASSPCGLLVPFHPDYRVSWEGNANMDITFPDGYSYSDINVGLGGTSFEANKPPGISEDFGWQAIFIPSLGPVGASPDWASGAKVIAGDYILTLKWGGSSSRNHVSPPKQMTVRVRLVAAAESKVGLSTLRVWTEPAAPTAGQAAKLFAEIENNGTVAGETTPVWSVNGAAVSGAQVSVPAGQKMIASIDYTFPSEGDVTLKNGAQSVVVKVATAQSQFLVPGVVMTTGATGSVEAPTGRGTEADPFVIPAGKTQQGLLVPVSLVNNKVEVLGPTGTWIYWGELGGPDFPLSGARMVAAQWSVPGGSSLNMPVYGTPASQPGKIKFRIAGTVEIWVKFEGATVPTGVDFINVRELRISGSPAVIGKPIRFEGIWRAERNVATDIKVTWYVNDSQIYQHTDNRSRVPVSAGTEAGWTNQEPGYVFSKEGSYRVRVVGSAINDENVTANNEASLTVTVAPTVPVVSNVTWTTRNSSLTYGLNDAGWKSRSIAPGGMKPPITISAEVLSPANSMNIAGLSFVEPTSEKQAGPISFAMASQGGGNTSLNISSIYNPQILENPNGQLRASQWQQATLSIDASGNITGSIDGVIYRAKIDPQKVAGGVGAYLTAWTDAEHPIDFRNVRVTSEAPALAIPPTGTAPSPIGATRIGGNPGSIAPFHQWGDRGEYRRDLKISNIKYEDLSVGSTKLSFDWTLTAPDGDLKCLILNGNKVLHMFHSGGKGAGRAEYSILHDGLATGDVIVVGFTYDGSALADVSKDLASRQPSSLSPGFMPIGIVNGDQLPLWIGGTVVLPPVGGDWQHGGAPPERQTAPPLGPYNLPITVTGEFFVAAAAPTKGAQIIIATRTGNGVEIQADPTASNIGATFAHDAATVNKVGYLMRGAAVKTDKTGDAAAQKVGEWVPFTVAFAKNGAFTAVAGGSNLSITVPTDALPAATTWYVIPEAIFSGSTKGGVAFRNISVSAGGQAPANPTFFIGAGMGAKIVRPSHLIANFSNIKFTPQENRTTRLEFNWDATGDYEQAFLGVAIEPEKGPRKYIGNFMTNVNMSASPNQSGKGSFTIPGSDLPDGAVVTVWMVSMKWAPVGGQCASMIENRQEMSTGGFGRVTIGAVNSTTIPSWALIADQVGGGATTSTTPTPPTKVSGLSPARMPMVTDGEVQFSLSDVTATLKGENLRNGLKARLDVDGWSKPLEVTIGEDFSATGESSKDEYPFNWSATGSSELVSGEEAKINFKKWSLDWQEPIFATPVRLKGKWTVLDENGAKLGEYPVEVNYLPYSENLMGGEWE